MGSSVTGNTTHRFRNTTMLDISRADASRVVTSDELDERLAETYARVGLRPGLLERLAPILGGRLWGGRGAPLRNRGAPLVGRRRHLRRRRGDRRRQGHLRERGRPRLDRPDGQHLG